MKDRREPNNFGEGVPRISPYGKERNVLGDKETIFSRHSSPISESPNVIRSKEGKPEQVNSIAARSIIIPHEQSERNYLSIIPKKKHERVNREQPPEPENTPKLPDMLPFMTAWDGTQPEVSRSERDVVAKRFGSLVDDVTLNHLDMVHTSSYGESSELHMRIEDEGDASLYLTIEKNDTSSRITIQRVVDGRLKEKVSYQAKDGTVTRRDVPMKSSLYAKGDKSEDVDIKINRIQEEIQNQQLEAVLGVNGCPIGVDELNGLELLVDKAQARKL